MNFWRVSFKSMISFCFVMGLFQSGEASTSKEVFEKYPNKYFIETGSYAGDGIQMALDAGFDRVYSIEVDEQLYKMCSERFTGSVNVRLFKGDSLNVFPQLLKKIDSPATFWLDGHYSGGSTGKGETNTPILGELDLIAEHPIKNHTILIDDVRLFGTEQFDYIEIRDIIKKIMVINPDYEITFEDGYAPNDVLVAKLP